MYVNVYVSSFESEVIAHSMMYGSTCEHKGDLKWPSLACKRILQTRKRKGDPVKLNFEDHEMQK